MAPGKRGRPKLELTKREMERLAAASRKAERQAKKAAKQAAELSKPKKKVGRPRKNKASGPPPARVSRKDFLIKRDTDRSIKEIDDILRKVDNEQKMDKFFEKYLEAEANVYNKRKVPQPPKAPKLPRGRPPSRKVGPKNTGYYMTIGKNNRIYYFHNGKRIKQSEFDKNA